MSKIGWVVIIVVVLLVVVALGATLFIPFVGRGFGPGVFRPGLIGGFGFPFILIRGIGTLLFWLLVIVAAIWLVRSLAPGAGTSSGSVAASETPFDILKRRYATGEIGKEQFEEMKNTLGV